jgi:cytochrome c oxidase assembly protein subunit 15
MIVAEGTVESTKAWTEMIHRYIAGSLGLLVLGLCISTYCNNTLHRFRLHSTVMVLLIIFQALLGMWTVTLKLHPTIVMSHLMGGMTLTALLWWLYLRATAVADFSRAHASSTRMRPYMIIALALVILQIMLGGWTSANYAALACSDFPGCHGLWWQNMHWGDAFSLTPPLNHDYEGGWLSHPARITIHMLHRMGALVVFLYLTPLCLFVTSRLPALRNIAIITLVILFVQLALGISNIVFFLPLSIAVLHNGCALLLLLSVLTLNVRFR